MDNLPDKSRPEADLHRISVNAVMLQRYADLQSEFEHNLRLSSRFSRNPLSYSAMATAESMALGQCRGYPEIESEYKIQRKKLDEKFGNPGLNDWRLFLEESSERKQLLENLLYDLGIVKIDERPSAPENIVRNYSFGFDGRDLIAGLYNKRLSQNRNLNVLITGKMGGGKSYGAVSVGQYVNSDFDLDKQLSYGSVEKFIEITRTLPAGYTVIFDELGLDAGNRDPMSNLNKTLSKLLQSTRYRNLLSIFTTPDLSFIDKSVRVLSDLILEHAPEQRQGEFFVYIPEIVEGGKVELLPLKRGDSVIRTVFFPLPSPAITKRYEELRGSANDRRLKDMQQALSGKNPKSPEADGRGKNTNSLANLRHFKKDSDTNE